MLELDTKQPAGPQTTVKCLLECAYSIDGHCKRCVITLFEKDGKIVCNQMIPNKGTQS